jgi:hypothetical protein
MLQAALKENSQSQLVGVGGDMRMLGVAEGTRGIVHRTYDIASKGERSIMTGSLLGKGGNIIIPLCTIYSFSRKKVRIGALPATRNGGSVEIYQQMMTSSTLK